MSAVSCLHCFCDHLSRYDKATYIAFVITSHAMTKQQISPKKTILFVITIFGLKIREFNKRRRLYILLSLHLKRIIIKNEESLFELKTPLFQEVEVLLYVLCQFCLLETRVCYLSFTVT